MLTWFAEHPEAAWLALALLLIGGEALAGTDLWLLMIGFGVLAGAGALALGLAVPFALLVTAAVSVLLLFLVRPSVLKRLHSGADLSNEPTRELLGRRCRAMGEISDDGGQIRVDGVLWGARPYLPGSRIAAGTPIEIFQVDGLTALVHPLEDPGELGPAESTERPPDA
jgi:membrane protein implicated in regulation of membrane protease activity